MNTVQLKMLEELSFGPEAGVTCTWKTEEFQDGIRFGLGLMDGNKGVPSPIVQRGGDRQIAWIPCDDSQSHRADNWESAYRSEHLDEAAMFAEISRLADLVAPAED